MTPAKAWRLDCPGWSEHAITYAPNRAAARWNGVKSMREANDRRKWPPVRARRAPAFDGVAPRHPGRRCFAPEYLVDHRCPVCNAPVSVRGFGPFFPPEGPVTRYALACREHHWRGRMCATRAEAENEKPSPGSVGAGAGQ